MKSNVGNVGDVGEDEAKVQFSKSGLFRIDRFSEERIHMGWDFVAQLLDSDTQNPLSDILLIQVKNYNMNILNGFAILDGAIEVWQLKKWELFPSPTLIVAYNNNEKWLPDESGYWIFYDKAIEQIEKRDLNWRERESNSKIRLKIPISNKLSSDGFFRIYHSTQSKYLQMRSQLKTKEVSPLGTATHFNISNEKLSTYSELSINTFFIDIIEQISSEYRRHDIISKICNELKYSEIEHDNLEFSMFPISFSVPYVEIQKGQTSWFVHSYGSLIANSEMNAYFNLILTSNLIKNLKNSVFSRGCVVSSITSLKFNLTCILISNDLFVEWMNIFPDRTIFEENQIYVKLDDNLVPIFFVVNELLTQKIVLINKKSVTSVFKQTDDTIPIKNFENDIPIGPRGKKMDIRIRSDCERNIEFVFRTVRSYNLVEPENIVILDFKS